MARKHENWVRNGFTCSANSTKDLVEARAKQIFKTAFETYKLFLDFRDKLGIMTKRIKFIQKKFADRNLYRAAKLEMLELYWTQVLGWFTQKGILDKDRGIKKVSAHMMGIDKQV